MEFGVFGVLMTSFPFCRATLLLIERVRFRISRSLPTAMPAIPPRRKPVVSSRYIGARIPCSFAALRYGPINASGRIFISLRVFFGILHFLCWIRKDQFSSTTYSNRLIQHHMNTLYHAGTQTVFFQLRLFFSSAHGRF